MSKGYEIPIKASNVEDSINKLDELLRKMKEVNRSAIDLRVRGGSGGYGGSSGRGGGSGGGRSSGPSDPWTRLQRANAGLGIGGSENELNAARLRQVRAQKAVDRANKELNPEPNDPLKTMFMRTRLKIGPWQPLVGDLVKNGLLKESAIDSMMAKIGTSGKAASAVAGLAKMAIPLLAIASSTAVSTVAGVAYNAAESFSANQRSAASAYYTGGGEKGLGQSIGIGKYLGLSPETMANRAVELSEKLRSGGYGAAELRSRGVVDIGPSMVNKFDNLIKSMDLLRKMEEKKAIRVARDMGLSDMLFIRDMNGLLYEAVKRTGGLGTNKQYRRNAGDYEGVKTVAGNLYDAGVNFIGGTAARSAIDPRRWNPAGFANGVIDDFVKYFMPDMESKDSGKDLSGSIKELTRTIKDSAEIIGGGKRSRTAIPAGWKHQMLDEALKGQAVSLGAFNVG